MPLNVNIVEDNSNDSIAISTVITICLVERILLDDGSALELLMWEAFKGINLNESLLRPAEPIYGFANQLI